MNATQTMAQTVAAEMMIVRIGTVGKQAWKQIIIIRDNAVTIVEMKPALLCGWNIERVTVQGEDDWCGMSASSIRAHIVDSGSRNMGSATQRTADEFEAAFVAERRFLDEAHGVNLYALRRLFGGEVEVPNRIEATSVPHIRRCLKMGLVEVVSKATLRLTAAGVAAIQEGE